MKPFFSIIVPCCDVEPYVRACFDSVLSQAFGDWEIIASVEESKDRTEEIVREYAAKDPRFKVFTGPRTGSCSVSRNIGIDNARGEYIIFLDGDDTITEGSLQRLHDKIAARPGADLYPCAIQVHNELTGKDEELRDNYPNDFNGELSGPEATLAIYQRHRAPCPMLQMTVFRQAYLVDNDLKCLYGRKRQDSEFSPRALYLAKRVIPLHEPYYIYRVRTASISTLAKSPDYFYNDYAAILKSLLAFHADVSRHADFDIRVSEYWARHWITWLCYNWFANRAIRSAARSRREETLQALFADGFANFDLLLRHATRARRAAGRVMKLFVRHPRLAWMADAFFLHVYNPLVEMRNTLRHRS